MRSGETAAGIWSRNGAAQQPTSIPEPGAPCSRATGGGCPAESGRIPSVFRVRRLRIPDLPPLSFETPPGAALAVIGPSGSGKTRLFRALADLDPHGGEASWAGRAAGSMPATAWRRQVGLLPAEPRFWAPTVAAHFPSDDPRLPEELVGLGLAPEVAGADPSRLSTGERARIALLRLLARRPAVLLLDEPTANLDIGSRQRVVRRLDRYRSERDAALLWVSHSPDEPAAPYGRLRLPEGTFEVFHAAPPAAPRIPR